MVLVTNIRYGSGVDGDDGDNAHKQAVGDPCWGTLGLGCSSYRVSAKPFITLLLLQ